MSGHNKWSTIKHKKGAVDAKRGKLFTKLIREITVSARMGGGDADSNPRLRAALLAARSANMPSDNIQRAIKRGTGELEGVNYDEITYEGYGPGGVAVLVETATDNKNRTVSEVRNLFTKYGGNMGESGCVSWMFNKRGIIEVPSASVDEDKLMEVALEGGAEDVQRREDVFDVLSAPADLHVLADHLRNAQYAVATATIAMIPQTTIKLEGHQAEVMIKLMNALEDNDDVQHVWANFDIDESLLEQLAGS